MFNTHYAKARCKACGDEIVSKGGGRFVQCKCGKSFIDQERFSAAWVRLGGEAEFMFRICPPTCEHPEHKKENIENKNFKGEIKRIKIQLESEDDK